MQEVRNYMSSSDSISFSANGRCRDIFWHGAFKSEAEMHSHNAKIAKEKSK